LGAKVQRLEKKYYRIFFERKQMTLNKLSILTRMKVRKIDKQRLLYTKIEQL